MKPKYLIHPSTKLVYIQNNDGTYTPYCKESEFDKPIYYNQLHNNKYMRYSYEYLIEKYMFIEFIPPKTNS